MSDRLLAQATAIEECGCSLVGGRCDLHAAMMERRWNIEAGRVGIVGSEYIDDPEAVFARVRGGHDRYAAARKLIVKLRRDRDAMDRIHKLLDGSEWDAGTIEDVAAIVTDTGREIGGP